MPDDALQLQVEAFASWENDEWAVIPIVRGVDPALFQAFYHQAHARLSERAKEWAKTQEKVPHWIGPSHPLAPWELRKKAEALEMEWRSRST